MTANHRYYTVFTIDYDHVLLMTPSVPCFVNLTINTIICSRDFFWDKRNTRKTILTSREAIIFDRGCFYK